MPGEDEKPREEVYMRPLFLHEAAAAAGRSPPARIERKDGRDEAVFRNWTFPEEEEDVFRDTV